MKKGLILTIILILCTLILFNSCDSNQTIKIVSCKSMETSVSERVIDDNYQYLVEYREVECIKFVVEMKSYLENTDTDFMAELIKTCKLVSENGTEYSIRGFDSSSIKINNGRTINTKLFWEEIKRGDSLRFSIVFDSDLEDGNYSLKFEYSGITAITPNALVMKSGKMVNTNK